jgi:hypothetical protein
MEDHMSEEITISVEEVDALAGKLDSLGENLTENEKAVLLLAFKLAGDQVAAESDSEVEGFGVGSAQLLVRSPGALPSLSSGFKGSFSPGGVAGVGSTRAITVDGGINVMGTSSAGKFGGAQF